VRLNPALAPYREACCWLLSLVCCHDPESTIVDVDPTVPPYCEFMVRVDGVEDPVAKDVMVGILDYMLGRIFRRVCVWCGGPLGPEERVAHGRCDLLDLYQRLYHAYVTAVARLRRWAQEEGRPDVLRAVLSP
jgi:hypothetical protein